MLPDCHRHRVIRKPTLLFSQGIDDLMDQNLIGPVTEFLNRPAKNLRATLVTIGYELAQLPQFISEARRPLCDQAAEIVEAVHAGSLVVDDIQDGSLERRGSPALHRQYGIPLALNAGNWLYFWPLDNISQWELPAAEKLRMYEVCNDALLKAHYGQALDVGIRINELSQDRIESVCLASLELKTGALTALAVKLGAILGQADSQRLELMNRFGHSFGIALQMFDDIGNLSGKSKPNDPKRFEDLLLRRPSWIWAVISKSFSQSEFKSFCDSVERLPETTSLLNWTQAHNLVPKAYTLASAFLDTSLSHLKASLPEGSDRTTTWEHIEDLATTLKKAYL